MRVPIVLLTGFLGSGKTSLLNGLLARRSSADAKKLAVIVNEFGDVGIDADLLPGGVTQQIELPGGCICCQLDEDLKKTLVQLLDSQPQLSRIIIETTGIAEPLPISWTLEGDDLTGRVRLDAVVTVVDALEHLASRQHSPSVEAQVRYADLLVLSKLDLAGTPDAALLDTLRTENPGAPIICEPRENVATALWELLEDPNLESTRPTPSADDHGHSHTHHDLQSAVLPMPGVYDIEDLQDELESLPPSVLRIKGIARCVDASSGSRVTATMAFHRVGARFSYEHTNTAGSPRIVAIGPKVDKTELAEAIAQAKTNQNAPQPPDTTDT